MKIYLISQVRIVGSQDNDSDPIDWVPAVDSAVDLEPIAVDRLAEGIEA